MNNLGKPAMIVTGLIVASGLYVAFVFFPIAVKTQILGYAGNYEDGVFQITRVFSGSPADRAGLSPGDVVQKQGGQSIRAWHSEYTAKPGSYTDSRLALLTRPAAYTVSGRDIELTPRSLNVMELLEHFGVRIFLIFFVLGLAIYILTSGSRAQSSLLTCLCFCFAAIWFASDRPYWPQFSSPLIRDLDSRWSVAVDLIELYSLQLVLATLLHISLLFPRERKVLERFRWWPVPIYVVALIVPTLILVFGDGSLHNRVVAAYKPRLYINSLFSVAITLCMIDIYRRCDSAATREQARWIVISMGLIAVVHLVFWNIPTLLYGRALVSNYNWILLTIVLLPVSLTMSITNHELFGIRGMIRGRIRLLETMLGHKRRLVTSRDRKIQGMQGEIRELRHALEQYTAIEEYGMWEADESLHKLEQKYPELTEIRRHRLIGVSPLWTEVFEHTVLAAHSLGPVMIVGESGTGKTDIAWTVHRLSARKDQSYKAVSCAQFEHADPAFALGRLFGIGSGHGLPNVPREGKKGLLQECDGGTLFLDDFDRLPLNVQDLFLYPLEGKPFEPGIGSGPSRSVSVKFIFATNSDPLELVAAGRFRSDVLARIPTRIDIPPLRQRPEDIPGLVQHFVNELSAELGHDLTLVSTRAMNLLRNSRYEIGNVRELRAEIQKAISKAMLEADNTLRAGYLSDNIRMGKPVSREVTTTRDRLPTATVTPGSRELEVLRKYNFQIGPAEKELGYSHKSKTLSNHLRGLCIQALVDSAWEIDQAALMLAGEGNAETVSKLRGKMDRLLGRIQLNVENSTERRLFNNLPVAYHNALKQSIDRVST